VKTSYLNAPTAKLEKFQINSE